MKKQLLTFLALFISGIISAQVGVGTTSPSNALDIETNEAGGTAIDINNTGTGDPKINLQLNGTTNFSIGVDNDDADKLKIGTTAPETNTRMTIDNTGNVGVGTSTPGAKLDVDGSAIFNESGGAVNFRVESDANTNMLFIDGTNNRVGVGTGAPDATFQVNGSFKLVDGNQSNGKVLTSDANGVATWQTASGGGLPAGTSGQTLRHDGTTWVANSVLFNNGTNVGVGTASPSEKLDIESNDATKTALDINNTGGGDPKVNLQVGGVTTFSMGIDNSDADKFKIGTSALETNTRLTIDNTGKVGIGTSSPLAPLHVVGSGCGSNIYERGMANFYYSSSACAGGLTLLKARGSSTAATTVINGDFMGDLFFGGYDGTSYLSTAYIGTQVVGTVSTGSIPTDIVFETGSVNNPGSEDMRITSAGNVGIGTSSPDQRLSVNGNASKTGGGTWATFSDKRLKKNINEFTDGLDKLMQINPVSFQYNGKAGYTNDSSSFVGVIAQDVEKVAPYMIEHVQKKLNENDSLTTDLLMYDGSALTYILVNAVKEQQAIINAQKAEIDILKANALKIAELENKINAMILLLNNKEELTVKQD